MEVGHGEGCRGALPQRKPERKRGQRVRVGEEEEERRGRKAGEGSRDGWRRDRVFKREGNTTQRPGALLVVLGVLGGVTAHAGDGLSPEFWGGVCRRLGRGGARYQGCSASILPGCRTRSPGYGVLGFWRGGGGGGQVTQHPRASSCSCGGKGPPQRQEAAASPGAEAVANSRRQRAIRPAISKRARATFGV